MVVIPVRDVVLCGETERVRGLREEIVKDAREGLGLQQFVERGFDLRVIVLGMHEFESRSSALAAASEGLVFAGLSEEKNSRELAEGLRDLAGELAGSFALAIAYRKRDPVQGVMMGYDEL